MKTLEELYSGINRDFLIKNICTDSKNVEDGSLFVYLGDKIDKNIINEVIKRGAKAIVVNSDVEASIPVIKVPDTFRELPYLCQKFYDYPDKNLKIIGVTGTDGKSITSSIIQTLMGKECGLIEEKERKCAKFSSENADTLDSYSLYSYLEEFVRFGCKYTVMEASSRNFLRGVFQAMEVDVSLYTNITPNHLNIHGTLENYISSKLKLFRQTKENGFCILNRNDLYFELVRSFCRGQVLTYGKGEDCDLEIVNFKTSSNFTDIVFRYKDNTYNITSPMLGEVNVYNLAGAMLACLTLGVSIDDIISRIKDIKIKGEEEFLSIDASYSIMVDSANTPNSIEKLLDFVHSLDVNRIIVVVGQEGNGDILNRSKVGSILAKKATYSIFTYQDPRGEDVSSICEDIIRDIKDYNNYEVVLDRRSAITKAIDMALENDIVLILGKGNDTYQEIGNEKVYFNDIEEAYNAVAMRNIKEDK